MSQTIVKSKKYRGSGRDVKDISLEGEVVGYLYQASSKENFLAGIFRAVGNPNPDQLDIFVVEIIGGQYANDLLFKMTNAEKIYFPTFVEGLGRTSIIHVFTSQKEARKYARETLGCKESLHKTLSDYIISCIQERSDSFFVTNFIG